MVALKGFKGIWAIYLFRFILLFSAIIPISLRVNLDMAKTAYSFFIMRDRQMPGTVVRSSTIPEDLGRISYLLTDKTGTLTQNGMVWTNLPFPLPLAIAHDTMLAYSCTHCCIIMLCNNHAEHVESSSHFATNLHACLLRLFTLI